jgi:hypothetical protein
MKHNLVFIGISQTQCNDEFPIVLKYICSNPNCGDNVYFKMPGLIHTKNMSKVWSEMETQLNSHECGTMKDVDESKDNS